MFKIFNKKKYPQKIDLSDQLKGFYGQHRSGWPYVLNLLSRLHNPQGIKLDSFIERTFCWHPDGVKPNLKPWIGFIHIPPNVPHWFQYEQSNDSIFRTAAWQQSLPHCRGLFTLSAYHRENLARKLPVPIENLIFPTEIPDLKWSWEKFQANKDKKVVQVGWWLRKLHTIFQLPTRQYKKIFLRITHTDLNSLLQKEREILINEGQFDDSMYETAETVSFLHNDGYDQLLSENIVIVNLYDSSANNTVIECLARSTPILVNPIASVIEYLGEDYPLYFTTLPEAARKLEDPDLIYRAHRYLQNHPTRKKLAGEYFLESFVDSRIYQEL
ncbi:MAG TPA: hypothetical protein VK469_22930 [Candidatus Kapabacteria bacterium]|nr:hypothetical protein [Candidatus Kapabacteria bacterium]